MGYIQTYFIIKTIPFVLLEKEKKWFAFYCWVIFCVVKKFFGQCCNLYISILRFLICIIVNWWFWDSRLLRVWFAPFCLKINISQLLYLRYCASSINQDVNMNLATIEVHVYYKLSYLLLSFLREQSPYYSYCKAHRN